MTLKLGDLVQTVVALAVFSRIIWQAWDNLINFLVHHGYSPIIEYVLGLTLFTFAVWLGAVQLKKVKR